MTYYTKGKVFEQGAIAEGTSSQGNRWQRMTLVLDIQHGQYTKKVAFQVMTANIHEVMDFKVGDKVEVGFDVSSREYTNKDGIRSWFTQVDLRSIKAADVPQVAEAVKVPEVGVGMPTDMDLPF